MKALVTGAKGFIGKNLVVALRRVGTEVAEIDVDSSSGELLAGVSGADVVFHLAGINRPEHDGEFQTGNVGSLEALFTAIDHLTATTPTAVRPLIVLSSSVQAEQDNPYGRSKLAAEQALEAFAVRTCSPAVIFRLPGVFGKWCRPNYNSVVATFCHNIARGLDITVNDPCRELELVYVDDVVHAFVRDGFERAHIGVSYRSVTPTFRIGLEGLAKTIRSFRNSRQDLLVPDMSDGLTKRLNATYLSYLEGADLAYALEVRTDPRGSLAELLKSPAFGQIFVSRTKPGITRGNHYHDLKVEKFIVLEGDAVIRFRHLSTGKSAEHAVSGKNLRVVDIPPGWTHSIENVSSGEMIVLFWSSEVYNPDRPDTYPAEVLK